MDITSQQRGKLLDGRRPDLRRADGEIKEDLVRDPVGARAEELFRGAVHRCEELGVTRRFLANRLGISYETIVAWLSPSKADRHVPWFQLFKLIPHLPDDARAWLVSRLGEEWGFALVAESEADAAAQSLDRMMLGVMASVGMLAERLNAAAQDTVISKDEAQALADQAGRLMLLASEMQQRATGMGQTAGGAAGAGGRKGL
jgi:hypothetical protein